MKGNKKIKFTLLIIAMLSISICLTIIPATFGYAIQSNGVMTSFMHDDKKLIEKDFYKSQAFDEASIRPIINWLSRSVLNVESEDENEKKYLENEKNTAIKYLENEKNIKFMVINNDTEEYYTNTKAKTFDEYAEIVYLGKSTPNYVELTISSKDNNIQYNKLLDGKVYEKVNLNQRLGNLINTDTNIDIYASIPKNLSYSNGQNMDRIYSAYNQFKYDAMCFKGFLILLISSFIVFLLSTILYKVSKVDLFDKDSFTIKVLNKIPLEIRFLVFVVLMYSGLKLFNLYRYEMYYYKGIVLYSFISIVYIFTLFMTIYMFNKEVKNINKETNILKHSLILKTFKTLKNKVNNLKEKNKNVPLIKRIMIIAGIGIIFNSFSTFILVILLGLRLIKAMFLMILCNISLVVFTYYIIKKLAYLSEIIEGTEHIKNGELTYKIKIKDNDNFTTLAQNINNIGKGLENSIGKQLKSEKMRSELITNVSHDLKTPLTSIMNYIELIKKEDDIKPQHINEYVKVLDSKSKRLKVLIDDLFEASKASSGNIELNMENIEFNQLLRQAIAEMEEKLLESNLNIKLNIPKEKIYIVADGKRLYRVLENMLSNIAKYSLSNTRVYIDLFVDDDKVNLTMKNISSYELNFNPDEIMERFKRGDESRNTEGSGLGLSIARDLVSLQGGSFDIDIDGDLFKVILKFDKK